MMIPGEMGHDGVVYGASVDVLGAYGVGKTRRAACDMLAGAVLDIAAAHRPLAGFKVTVADHGKVTIYLTSNDPVRLTSMLLRCQREEHEMSLADVAQRMGGVSRSAYAQYEQGRREPSIGKLQELLTAVAPDLILAIIPRTARVVPQVKQFDDAKELDALLRDPTPANAAAFRAKSQATQASSPTTTKAKRLG